MAADLGSAKTHICPGCEFPIATYGVLRPCSHAYCLRCSSRLVKCAICQQSVASVERLERGSTIFISPVTLESFTEYFADQADIEDHIAGLRKRMEQR